MEQRSRTSVPIRREAVHTQRVQQSVPSVSFLSLCSAVLVSVAGCESESANPCQSVSCSSAGECVVVNGQPSCNCDLGYSPEPSLACVPICGDGLVVEQEECDDGGELDGDGCTEDCRIEPGWTCVGATSHCDVRCGDGMVIGDETCDDGNTSPLDGCSNQCQVEPGWNCTGQPSECVPVIVVHVGAGASTRSPTGESWSSAFPDLQSGLDHAQQLAAQNPTALVQVWVKKGRYSPYRGSSSDRYVLYDGITLLGGFLGTETTPEGRDPWRNDTVLDGQGQVGTVMAVEDLEEVVIDGFVNGVGRATTSLSFKSGWFDKNIVDGFVNFLAFVTQVLGAISRLFQTGSLPNYMNFMVGSGLLGFIVYFFFL